MRRPLALPLCVIAFASGCGGSEPGEQQRSLCLEDTRAEAFIAGFEKMSTTELFRARVIEGTPAPPDRGNNTWMLEILTPGGSPGGNIGDVRVRAWMPDHGHGTNPLWNEATEQSDGRFEVGPFNLFMPGLWQFTVSAEVQNQSDTAIMSFCIEG